MPVHVPRQAVEPPPGLVIAVGAPRPWLGAELQQEVEQCHPLVGSELSQVELSVLEVSQADRSRRLAREAGLLHQISQLGGHQEYPSAELLRTAEAALLVELLAVLNRLRWMPAALGASLQAQAKKVLQEASRPERRAALQPQAKKVFQAQTESSLERKRLLVAICRRRVLREGRCGEAKRRCCGCRRRVLREGRCGEAKRRSDPSFYDPSFPRLRVLVVPRLVAPRLVASWLGSHQPVSLAQKTLVMPQHHFFSPQLELWPSPRGPLRQG